MPAADAPAPSSTDRLRAAAAFRRRRPPAPIEPFKIPHPALPPALDGLTILHLADLHARTPMLGRRWFSGLLDALAATPADLIALTGDYMDGWRHSRAALKALHAIAEVLRPRLGTFGVFGNHDTVPFMKHARDIRNIQWLDRAHVDLSPGSGDGPAAPLRLLGAHWPEDLLAAVLKTPELPGEASSEPPPQRDPFTIVLAHTPTTIVSAAALNLPLVLAGHTHAGQIRLSPRIAPHTSSDLPAHLASGVLRLRGTLCCVSRGMGEAILERLRFNCPRHVPLYTLRHGELPRPPKGTSPEQVTQVIAW